MGLAKIQKKLTTAQFNKLQKQKADRLQKLNTSSHSQLKGMLIKQHPNLAKEINKMPASQVHRFLQMPQRNQLIALKAAIKKEKASSRNLAHQKATTEGKPLIRYQFGGKQTGQELALPPAMTAEVGLTPAEKNVVAYLKMSNDKKGLADFFIKKKKGRR
jgi:hypothetical protein